MASTNAPQDTEQVRTTRPIAWRYTSEDKAGVCRLANSPILVTVELSTTGDTFHDVYDIERWLTEYLSQPTTAEEMAVACCERWNMDVRLTCTCDTHGPIVCEVKA